LLGRYSVNWVRRFERGVDITESWPSVSRPSDVRAGAPRRDADCGRCLQRSVAVDGARGAAPSIWARGLLPCMLARDSLPSHGALCSTLLGRVVLRFRANDLSIVESQTFLILWFLVVIWYWPPPVPA